MSPFTWDDTYPTLDYDKNEAALLLCLELYRSFIGSSMSSLAVHSFRRNQPPKCHHYAVMLAAEKVE